MAVYTVQVRPASDPAGEPAIFVADEFSRAAFFLGPVWFIWQRAWLGLALWIGIFALGAAAAAFWRAPAQVDLLLLLLGATLTGLEANNLRRVALERRGYACVDVASGDTIEAAERSFFNRAPPPPPPPLRAASPPAPAMIVGGLFPHAGG